MSPLVISSDLPWLASGISAAEGALISRGLSGGWRNGHRRARIPEITASRAVIDRERKDRVLAETQGHQEPNSAVWQPNTGHMDDN
jgi:hypothetical protein